MASESTRLRSDLAELLHRHGYRLAADDPLLGLMTEFIRLLAVLRPALSSGPGAISGTFEGPKTAGSRTRPESTALVYTVGEAAAVLRVSRTKVYELVAGGEIESFTIGRSRRISRDALARYLTNRGAELFTPTQDGAAETHSPGGGG